MRRQVLLLLFSLFAIVGFAQQRTVTGTVVSAEDGLPVIGASVHVKGTSQGATTDLDGKYSIKVNENASLTFSYVGMQPKTVQVGNQSVINVTLTSSSTQLDEVVVTAMGIREEKKKLKKEQQAQRKEAKRRAKEIAKQEDALDDGSEGNSLLTFGATILIVVLWMAVICAIIKLDIGGFGSSVVTPILKDVPVLNKILPANSITETTDGSAYGGYTSLEDAVDQIKSLELQLEQAQTASAAKEEELDQLKAEVLRLKEFENQQVEFQRIQKEFYDEVVYSDKGPGAEEYKKYYESMDPATAEYIYKQVVTQLEESQEIQDYAAAYSAMKPKQAAAIFEQMTNNLDLAARILKVMSAEDRGKILGAMNSEVAAKITKIMDPES